MKVAFVGKDGPVAAAARFAFQARGHEITAQNADCAVFFPGSSEELRTVVERSDCKRLVLRSHAYAYGSNAKNPGLIPEGRVSLLPEGAPEHRWLELEEIAAAHRNSAMLRMVNVLAAEEGDVIVRQLASRSAIAVAGRDPNVQFLSIADAASAIVAAAESNATGMFNITGQGCIPLKKAYRAAGTHRIPLFKPLARLSSVGRSVDQIEYNWSVSGERACRDLGWQPTQSTIEALRDFLQSKASAQLSRLKTEYDDWGLDVDYIRAWGAWLWFLRNIYWRIDHEGLEHIPPSGRALFVSNHRGFMPLDAVMHLSLIFTQRHRVPRFLIISSLLRFPFLCNFLTKLGGVVASQENATRLFANESLVGIFPEGIRGTFTPYKQAYTLRNFSRSGFARMAIENEAPVIPAAVVGHAEIFPIIGRIDSSFVTREFGWPYLPIAPMFPLAPVPLPSKWHVRVLPPVPLQGLRPADAENIRIVNEFSRHIQDMIQHNIDDMVRRRKHVFWGHVLNGSAPAAQPFELSLSRGARQAR